MLCRKFELIPIKIGFLKLLKNLTKDRIFGQILSEKYHLLYMFFGIKITKFKVKIVTHFGVKITQF